jgi:hypothetical protein
MLRSTIPTMMLSIECRQRPTSTNIEAYEPAVAQFETKRLAKW